MDKEFPKMQTKDGLELIIPMKAKGVKDYSEIEGCHNENWVAESKLDGHYFTAYYKRGEKIRFFSRSIATATGIFTERTENLECLQIKIPDHIKSFTVCGEIVHRLGKDKVTSTIGGLSENSRVNQRILGEPSFVMFDLLEYNGEWKHNLPYQARRYRLRDFRAILREHTDVLFLESTKQITSKGEWFLVRDHVTSGIPIQDMYEHSIRQGFEGCVYKLKTSPYYLGYGDKVRANKCWIKHKVKRTFDVVIMDYTEGEGKFTGQIGAIVFGQYKNGELIEIGRASGMTDLLRAQITKYKDSYIGDVIIVEAQERSTLARLRHPQFKGFHPEKVATDCIWDEAEC